MYQGSQIRPKLVIFKLEGLVKYKGSWIPLMIVWFCRIGVETGNIHLMYFLTLEQFYLFILNIYLFLTVFIAISAFL